MDEISVKSYVNNYLRASDLKIRKEVMSAEWTRDEPNTRSRAWDKKIRVKLHRNQATVSMYFE